MCLINSYFFHILIVCCMEVVLYVKRRNTIITFVGRRTDDNTYWFGNKIMTSISEIVGIDALVWKSEIESWTVCVFISIIFLIVKRVLSSPITILML